MKSPLFALSFVACTASSTDAPSDADPTPTPTPTPTATSGAFTALTYNVQGLPDALSDAERPTPERMERIGPLLGEYDLALLQEDFDPDNHALLTDAAPHPDRSWFDDLYTEERVYGSGLAVLSGVGTLVEIFEEHYTTCNGVFDSSSDCLASKGFQVVRIAIGGAEIDIYNTHHEAGGGEDDEIARAAQVDQVLASMADRSAGRAIVFGGDTNLRFDDPPDAVLLERYLAAGLRDACREVGCAEDDHIDRFMVADSDALRLTVTGWDRPAVFVDEDGADLSDHPPIVATIAWEAR